MLLPSFSRNGGSQRPLLLLLAVVAVVSSLIPPTQSLPWEPKIHGPLNLTEIATYLRANDRRIVRPAPSDRTYFRQKESGPCVDRMDEILAVLTDDSGIHQNVYTSLRERARAAEVAALCATDQPTHRRTIGNATLGVHKSAVGLVGLLRGDALAPDVVAAAAAGAAELIWILTFSNSANHRAFVEADAVGVLGRALVACGEGGGGSNEAASSPPPGGCTPQVQMWIAAALQNLAASYCETPDGRCEWEWNDEDELVLADYDEEDSSDDEEELGVEEKLVTYEEYRKAKEVVEDDDDDSDDDSDDDDEEEEEEPEFNFTGHLWIDASGARETMLNIEGLVPELTRLACAAAPRDGSSSHPMPGDGSYETGDWRGHAGNADVGAEIGRDELNPAIVPWAAAGALKNLALSEAGREAIMPASLCLCALMGSPDWLESAKAEDALHYLGRDDHCHYRRVASGIETEKDDDDDDDEMEVLESYCLDKLWTCTDGHTCMNLNADADPSDCDKFGTAWKDKDGTTAQEACCICGGGESPKPSDERSEL